MTKFVRQYYDDKGRVCTTCLRYLPYLNFHRHSQCVKGYNVVCKECRKPISKNNYANKSLEYNLWHRAKTRAKERNIPFNIEISDIRVPKCCPVFYTKFEVNNHKTCASIDRIIPELGYVKGNIQIISNRANMIKGDASVKDIEKVYKWLLSCEVQ